MKFFLSLFALLVLFSTSSIAQADSKKKYEYVMLVQNLSLASPTTLEVLYPDGHMEKIATLKGSSIGKRFYLNLATLLQAFNYLGDKGYELVPSGDQKDSLDLMQELYIFKREL